MTDSEVIAQAIADFEGEIAALRARFDQYFLGMEKKNPAKELEALKKRIMKFKGQHIRNTGLKFRVQTLYSKFQSYERLWSKSLKEIEEGTYRKDLMRLRRKNQARGLVDPTAPKPAEPGPGAEEPKKRPDFYTLDEDFEADLPVDMFDEDDAPVPVAKPPPAPAAARPPPAPVAAVRPPPAPAAAIRPPPAPAEVRPPPAPTARPPAAPAPAARQPAAAAPMARQSTPPAPPTVGPARAAMPAAPSSSAPPGPPATAVPPPPPRAALAPRTASGSFPVAVTPASRPPPAPAAVRAAATPADVPLSKEKLDQICSAYITAKKRCKESTVGITPEAIAQSLRKQVPALIEQHGAKSVDFKVVIKDGKAVLKAVPKG